MRVGTGGEKAIGFGYALNISEEGMAVDAQALADESSVPSVGNEIRMRFKLPKSDLVITLLGKVVRVECNVTGPRLALLFLDTTPDIRAEISRFVQTQVSATRKT